MTEFVTPVDIGNRSCQILGIPRIFSLTDSSAAANEINFAYDKLRVAELREHIWKFTVSVAVLVPANPPTLTYSNGVTQVTRNLYQYPTGYIRPSTQDPRGQGTIVQRTTGGMQYSDFDFLGPGIATALTAPSFFFVFDITAVTAFDPSFAEALAARIAWGTSGMLAPDREQYAFQLHEAALERAIELDAIEVGNMEPNYRQLKTARLNTKPPQQGG